VGEGEITVEFSGATPPLRFLSIPNQTLDAHVQGFEVQLAASNGSHSWVQVAAAVVPGSASVRVHLPAAPQRKQAEVLALRYAWQSIPTTQLLFDSTRIGAAELTGLPAPPFWANCSSSSSSSASKGAGGHHCELITPGTQLPPPPPPTPAPPPPPDPAQCPRAALPTAGPCVFTNNSAFVPSGATPTQIQVSLDDYSACCKACTAEPACLAASMSHGPKSAPYDFCDLYTTGKAPSVEPRKVSCPSLAVTLVPRK
jgi:hypothetical protein